MAFAKPLAGAALAAMLALTPGAASAGHDGDVIAGAALGALGGFLLGQASAPQPLYAAPPPVYAAPPPVYAAPQPVYVPGPPVYRRAPLRQVDLEAAHVSWCESRYRSYSYADNTFIDRRGRVRVCQSPYGY